MQGVVVLEKPRAQAEASVRLHYLDWLRVLAIVGVFLYHSIHPFDFTDWHIKNAELSIPLTAILLFTSPWGMPFFFLIAGTGTWFALQHRSARQYIIERFQRLLIPFVVGCLLLSPLMLFLEWSHKTQVGLLTITFWEFLGSRGTPVGPQIFGWLGYHLWFLGFLFSFSMLGVPLFIWLRGDAGKRVMAWLLRLCEQRGGVLLAVVPLAAVQVILRIFFTEGEHNWADFFYMFTFFVLGYILYADKRFAQLILRDWWIILVGAAGTSLTMLPLAYYGDVFSWMGAPQMPEFYGMWILFVINGWCWTLLLLLLGMHSLNFSNHWLRYGQEAIVPFFVLHQPVIMAIAFFVVQWDAAILPKLLVVVCASFAVTWGLYEACIRHVGFMRRAFGMKS